MSELKAIIPISQIKKIQIYVNRCEKTMAQVQNELGCDYIINAGMWNSDGTPCEFLRVGGKDLNKPVSWNNWVYGWDTPNNISMISSADAKNCTDMIGVVGLLTPWNGLDSKINYPSAMGGSRGRSAMGIDNARNLILYCSKDGTSHAKTPEGLRQYMWNLGCKTAMMFDGGGSSQCKFKSSTITASRKVHNFICIWLKNDNEENSETRAEMNNNTKKVVVLDPGHGVETAGKCAPDKSYYEHEFNLSMAMRVKEQLERHGVNVILTRSDTHDVSLSNRVKIANNVNADLFVSLHSNASGDGAKWTEPDGFGIYTSAKGDTAKRNILAKAIITRAKDANIKLWGNGLFHNIDLYVLRNTISPACLIEHGFHTNKAETELLKSDEYRNKLAIIDAKGILDCLGIAWIEPKQEEEKKDNGVVKSYSVVIPVLSRGNTGVIVKGVQNMLIANGYTFGTYGADGSFGPTTEKVVKQYQKDNNLAQTGQVDMETFVKLLGLNN